MIRLKHRNEAPPGGWQYFQAETKVRITGLTGDDAAWAIMQHRQYKGLERASFQEAWLDMEAQLCERLGGQHCIGMDAVTDYSQTTDAEAVIGFTKGFIKYVTGGFEMCAEEEAKARAEVCFGCHLNMEKKGCTTCDKVVKFIESTVPSERRIEGLNNCAVCGCALKAKVNATAEVIKAADSGRNIKYPKHCWINSL